VERPAAATSPGPGAQLEPGYLVKGRWKVVKSVGKGAFGEIFECEDIETNVKVAIKTEKLDSKKRVLKIEVAVLKKLQACPFVCRYQQFGRHDDFHFVVMELLGENLSVLRKRQPGKKFSVGTTMRLGMQMVRAIEGMHDHGYLHRDIKPSNFAMGRQPENRDWCFLIDFGLARRYVLPSGDIRTARESAGFRGTARYASINSHLSKELSRRDDLWSLLYMIIEFLKGSLPWSNIENKEDVGRRKIELDSLELVKDLQPEMKMFVEHLHTLDYKDKPNYDYIMDLFNQIMEHSGHTEDEPYDWEAQQDSKNNMHATSPKHKRPVTGGGRRPKEHPQQADPPRAKTKRTPKAKRDEAPVEVNFETGEKAAQNVSESEEEDKPAVSTGTKVETLSGNGAKTETGGSNPVPNTNSSPKDSGENAGGGCRCAIS